MNKILTLYFMIIIPLFSLGNNGDNPNINTNHTEVSFLLDYINIRYHSNPANFIYIGLKRQKLYLIEDSTIIAIYDISSAKNGIGFIDGSEQTPTGLHRIRTMIGDSVPIGGILKERRYTGKQAMIVMDSIDIQTEDVTTRIIWLDGCEEGINKGRNVDSYKRNIYIHGTPAEGVIGKPASHGCIRMRNNEVVDLYNKVYEGMLVIILNN